MAFASALHSAQHRERLIQCARSLFDLSTKARDIIKENSFPLMINHLGQGLKLE